MIESIDGFILVKLLHGGLLFLVVSLLHFLHEGLEVTELLQQRLVGQVLDVLGVVVCSVGGAPFVHLLEAFWLMWVDALQDTQTSM